MKNLLFLVILLSTFISNGQDEKLLVLNPQGHKGQIRDLVISNDGKYLVTGSFDKTIKKWDVETGEVVLEYRSQIGRGAEGMVYFLALSPNNKYLAAGGWFGEDDESDAEGDIRIFDFYTGKLIKVLKGLEAPPEGLGFTNDSKGIIAADIYSKIFKWDISTGELTDEFIFHKFEDGKELSELSCSSDRIMSLDKAKNICLWDVNKPKKPLVIDNSFFKELDKMGLGNIGEATNLAISPTLQNYAFSLENYIIVLDDKFEPYFMIQDSLNPGFLKFSSDGNRLMTGSVRRGTNHHSFVFEKQDNGDWIEIADFDYAKQGVIAGGFLDNNTLVSAGGENNEIYIWSVEKESNGKQKLLKHFKTNTILPYGVALNGNSIAYSDVWTENFGLSKLNKQFNLFLKEVGGFNNSFSTVPPKFKHNNYSIKWSRVGDGLNALTAGLEIKKENSVVKTLKRDEFNGSRHVSYTITNNGYIISGGNQGWLEAYTLNGTLKNRFVGHEGMITAVAESSDGKNLITASDDNTIKIWSLDKLGVENTMQPKESFWEAAENYMGKNNVMNSIITQLKLSEEAKTRTFEAWDKTLVGLKKAGYKSEDGLFFFEDILLDYKATWIYPKASVFITNENEWIIWNEKGYFSASKKGAKYVGYHLNQGKDAGAKFYPFEQFDLKFNRPDIILKDLGLGDEKIIDFYYKAYLKRLKKMHITESQLSADIHLPEMKILEQNVSSDNKFITLKINAIDSKYNLDRINIYLNDVPVLNGSQGFSLLNEHTNQYTKEFKIELAEGKNKIQVSVLNEVGVESLKETKVVFTPKSGDLPTLYLLTIGTSQYKDARFNLKYAAKDALDIEKMFEKDVAYSTIKHITLTDEDVTKDNVLKLKSHLQQAGRNDVVMVFIAGHGLLDEKFDYYYATYDVDFNNPSNNGMIYSEIENLLDGLTALKKLLFMDTCHSGEVDSDDVEESNEVVIEEDITFRNAGVGIRKKVGEGMQVTSELVKELFSDVRKGTGSTVISSAGGAEYAMESDEWKNGLFTYCLLHGLQDKSADTNNDGVIMLSEMQNYVHYEVAKLSKGKQKPTSRIENLTLDFPIW